MLLGKIWGNNVKKLLFLTGSRGEWGYIRPILRLIEKSKDVDYSLVVTNMHLLPAYGSSYKEIEREGFHINHKIRMAVEGGDHVAHAKSLGVCLDALPDILDIEQPDWVVLAGDRGEQLMGAIAASYCYIPVAHIQAGELSGNIDGMTRHAIGKLVHMHFAANQDAADRLIKLGEEPFRVFNVGAPQIDEMVAAQYTSISELEERFSVDLSNGFLLAVMHPVTEEMSKAGDQAKIFVEALNQFDIPKIVILPNNDAGSLSVKNAILANRKGDYHLFANLKREDYLGFLKEAKCIVGNSSSGLLEAPTFKTPSVNIGRRQDMRFRGKNVIDVSFDVDEIKQAIDRAISPEFEEYLSDCGNPYGDGHSSERILDLLVNTIPDSKWMTKKLMY